MVFIITGVWIFKEVRKGLLEIDRQNSDRIDKALLIYGELEALLLLRRNDNTTDINQKVVSAYPYFEKKLIKKSYILREDSNQENIDIFLAQLKSEIMRLKGLQIDPVSIRPSENFLEEIIFFLRKTKFSSFIDPIVFLTILFFLIALLSSFSLSFDKASSFGKIVLFDVLIVIILNFIILFKLLYSLIDNKFKHNLKNWIILCSLVGVPALLIWKMHYQWPYIFIDSGLTFIYIICFMSNCIKIEDEEV